MRTKQNPLDYLEEHISYLGKLQDEHDRKYEGTGMKPRNIGLENDVLGAIKTFVEAKNSFMPTRKLSNLKTSHNRKHKLIMSRFVEQAATSQSTVLESRLIAANTFIFETQKLMATYGNTILAIREGKPVFISNGNYDMAQRILF